MMAPPWIEAVVRDFGRAAGLGDFALSAQGVAALRFENGVALRFEFTGDELAIAATAPAPNDPASARRILAFSHPSAKFGFKIRSGLLARSGAAVFAVRLAAQDVTMPAVNAAFEVLWRIASEMGGAA
jgi:type III secretion system chaperone SycN